MPRWVVRIALSVAVLVVIVVIALQVLFWTKVPRNLVIGAVQQALGLRVTAATLSTGFFGHTTLTDVTLALPLADESFFKVERLEVEHTSIPGLIFKRTVAVQSVEMQSPRIVVRQDAAGNWNLQDVVTLIGRAGGSGNPQQAERPATTLQLPKITIVDGSVLVVANNGQQAEIAPLTVRGDPEKTLTWKYDISIGKQLSAVGRVAPGGVFKHEVDIKLQDVDEWIALVSPGFKHDIHADGTWRGQLVDGGVAGQFQLKSAGFDQLSASGTVDISAGATIEARPSGLTVRTGNPILPELTVLGGVVRRDASGIVADQIRATISGGKAALSARYEPASRNLTAGAIWQDVRVVGTAVQSGSFNLAMSEPLANRPQIEAKLTTAGHADEATWDLALNIAGEGRSYTDIDWTVTADRLALKAGKRRANLAGTIARVTTTDKLITLHSLQRPDATALAGSGQFDLAKNTWNLWLDGKGPRLPGGDEEPLTFMVNAWSTGRVIVLDQLYLRDSELELTSKGYYITANPDPVFLNLSLSQLKRRPARLSSTEIEQRLVGGQVLGDFYVYGKLDPIDLYLQGWLTGKNVVIANRDLGDLKIALDGKIDPQRQLTLTTQELSFLDGKWSIDAVSPTPWDSTRFNLKVRQLPLRNVGELAGRDDFSGIVNGRWTFEAASFARNEWGLNGTFDGKDLKVGPLVAQTLEGKTRLRNGTLTNELKFNQDAGDASIVVATALADPLAIGVVLDVNNWPTAFSPRSRAVTSIDANLRVDAKAKSAVGIVSMGSNVFLDDKSVGEAKLQLDAAGRVIRMTQLHAQVLGGTASGVATVDLDRPLTSVVDLNLSNLDATSLASVIPQAADLKGQFKGSFKVAPNTNPRPIAPLAVTLNLSPTEGSFRGIPVGDVDARLAVDYSETFRAVLDQCTINLAGGKVELWGRASQHNSNDPVLVRAGKQNFVGLQGTVRLVDLDLHPIVQAYKPDDRPVYARVSGEVNVFADSSGLDTLVGGGSVSLEDAKLTNFKPVGLLLTQMNASEQTSGNGRGGVIMRIEKGRVDINEFNYFEAGIEMLGVMTIYDIVEKRMNAPVNGTLVGTLRPFRDTKISILSTADDIFSLVQSQLSTVVVSGTLADLIVRQGLATEIGAGLKQIITGDVQSKASK